MNKFLFNVLAALLLAVGVCFTSCSDDDDENMVAVKFSAAPMVEGTLSLSELEGMKVVFTDIRNQDKTTGTLNAAGECEVLLAISTYDIAIEETIKNAEGDDVVVATRLENISINEMDQKVEAKVNSLPAKALGKNFIFSEIFFNGERNSGRMMHPDQYIVVFNPSNETLYADGLSIAVTQHLSWQDKQMWYDEYYNSGRIPVGGFITIPGTGKEHPVAPGERFVIAFTAIDHSKVEGYDHAVDLSGADYEIYYGPDATPKDQDNPEVPNVLLTENVIDKIVFGFFFQPRGYVSPLMFKLENGTPATVEAFAKAHTSKSKHLVPADDEKGTPEAVIEINILSVDTKDVIDGVQTSDVPQDVKTRVIPEIIDRGKFLVNGCHRQELAIRKTIKVGDKTFYQDTNNSSEDFEDVNKRKEEGKVQNSFPKGWRNK